MSFIEVWEKEVSEQSFWSDKYSLEWKLLGRTEVTDMTEATKIVNENFDFSEYMVYYVYHSMDSERKIVIKSWARVAQF